METEPLVVQVKPKIKDQFRQATRENGSNMTAEINRFIRKYLEQQKDNNNG